MAVSIENFLNIGRKIIPRPIFRLLQIPYHFILAYFGALIYGFPSKRLKIVGVTGTKGKSSTIYILEKIFGEAGKKIGIISSLTNSSHQTMPGRFKIQKALKEFVDSECEFVFLEVTSEGIRQFRHRFINFYAAIFTNLAPEHIESHGSFEKYREAKLKLFRHTKNIHIINKDDENSSYFLNSQTGGKALKKITYSLTNWMDYPVKIKLKLPGEFNFYNMIAATTFANIEGVDFKIIKKAIEKIEVIPGRMESISEGQNFKVIIDYAHTPDSLEKVYQTLGKFKSQKTKSKLICVLGAAGGGRDKWKRPIMGEIAGRYCEKVILTNEDPYNEDPEEIIRQIERGLVKTEYFTENYWKILDRQEAIKKVLQLAGKNDTVVITGKGVEPSIIAKGKVIPWNEKDIVKYELKKLLETCIKNTRSKMA